MKKFALLLSFVFAAGVVMAADAAKSETTAQPAAAAKSEAAKPAAKPAAAKTHEVKDAEVTAVDADKKTISIKTGDEEKKDVPVEGKAVASLKSVKAGDKVTLTCRDNEAGEHQAVTAIKKSATAKAPEKPAAEKK